MGKSIIRYYFSDDEFIMKWMSNSLVVTPFLKIIRKPALMLINHHLFPVLLLVQSGKWKSSVSLWLYPLLALDTCYMFSRALHYIHIHTTLILTQWKSKLTACVVSLLVSHVLQRPFFAGGIRWNRPRRFYFPNPDQVKYSGDFAFCLFIYARICTWIARLL